MLQSPPQPPKVCVASFQLAVSVTSSPSYCVDVPGVTLPPPVAVTVSACGIRSNVTLAVRAALMVSVHVVAVPPGGAVVAP